MKRMYLPLVAALLVGSAPAYASLGNPMSSILADGAPASSPMRAQSLAALSNSGVTATTIVTPDGVSVTEFASQGVVFGLSWQGRTMPDLKTLLSNAFPIYQNWVQSHTLTIEQPVGLRSNSLVVVSAGRS